MAAHRILIGLMQPLLALLLIAGMAQAEPAALGHGSRLRVIDHSFEHLTPSVKYTGPESLKNGLSLTWNDSDNGPDPALLIPGAEAIPVGSYRIATGRSAYPTAPPSHRPCAAPPTGPPLV